MIDVGAKPVTLRRAVAQGRIAMSAATFAALVGGRLKKGDPRPIAEVAGIQAAKRTPELLPLCHPLPLEQVRVRFELEAAANAVRVECEARATAKTGVEMEALTGASVALLTIYDVLKAENDSALTISDVKLLLKEGGKTLPRLDGVRVAVLTVSDRVAKGADDVSGPLLTELAATLGALVGTRRVVSDERAAIATALRTLAAEHALVLTTGGTGLSPRDVTPEALEDACDKLVPGLGEAFRARTARFTSKAWLSRATAGLCGTCLIVALPGSPQAVREGFAALAELLPHALHIAAGGNHG